MRQIVNFPLVVGGGADSFAAQQLMTLNKKTCQFGLTLSARDALELIETRNSSLKGLGRVEVGGATVGKIIDAFCTSAYIQQQDYSNTLHELVEIFYYYKNETLELISDDELIELMKEYYEKSCKGSLELLKYRELDKVARNLRCGIPNYLDLYQDEEDILEEDDEE